MSSSIIDMTAPVAQMPTKIQAKEVTLRHFEPFPTPC